MHYQKGKRMKKHLLHKSAALLSAACMCTSLLSALPVSAAEEGWVSDADLMETAVSAPEKDAVLPDANQFRYHKNELSAFCHFGPNTFNEIEWGEHYGNSAPSAIFRLTSDFDEDTYVRALKEAGFTKLIVTAKHHDGFCIWDSAWTEYDAPAAGYKNGEGDVLAELSAACTKYGLEMGLYLSPWDIHDDSYGYKDADGNPLVGSNGLPLNGRTWEEVYELDVKDYNEYYNNQLQEILGNPKYGNNGHFTEVWMDGAKGSGSGYQEYDFPLWFETIQNNEGKAAGYDADCMLFGAESYTGVRWIGNELGYAAKNTWAKSRTNRENNTIDSNTQGSYTVGWEDGNQWTVPEADARITSGWFWGNNKKTPKTLKDLGNMYFGSVGNNSVFLLNIPPNSQGTVDEAILQRVDEFGQAIRETFDDNLAVSVSASEVRGQSSTYSPMHLLDNDDETVWAPEDGTSTAQILVDLGGLKTMDVVSIEEAIQYGQRIHTWKAEARLANGSWKVLDEGETIGARKLVRTGALRADQIRITVTVPEGKVPVLSEVGVYKAAEGFEKTGMAPAGMDVTDIADAGFSFTGTWHAETGDSFINGTNKYANPGASATLSFHGTRAWLLGTIDPNHGTADIYVDDAFVKTIDMSGSARALGQKLFDTGDLSDGDHTIRVETKTKATGLEAAYIINNDGKGMVGLESSAYTMNENEEMEVKLIRLGGADNTLSVTLSPNPGSAIQDDFDTELISTVTFQPGETEKTALVRTRRNTNATGDRQFSVELSSTDEQAILGWQDRAVITIRDAEAMNSAKLLELVTEARSYDLNVVAGDWSALQEAIVQAEAQAAAGGSAEVLQKAYDALQRVMASFTDREAFSEEDPFTFPGRNGKTTLEAEYSILEDVALASDGIWALCVSEADWASRGRFVNCLNQQDRMIIPYTAKNAGTYKVKAWYRSGDPENALAWEEENGKLVSGSVIAGASDKAAATHSVEFTVEIAEPGAGRWVFTGPDRKSPQLDRFEIEALELDVNTYAMTATCTEGGTISGPSEAEEGGEAVFVMTPDEGYVLEDVLVNGESVGAQNTLRLENIEADMEIYAVFAFAWWSQANPFVLPQDSAVLEAEELELHNTGENEAWPMQISTGDWCENGKFLNAMNTGDTAVLHYDAPAAGTYNVTLYYRSGDPQNSFSWSEANGKISAGSVTAGAPNTSETHTAEFTWTVNEAGPGMLTLLAGSRNAPQMDRFVLTKAVSTEALSSVIAQAEARLQEGNWTEDSVQVLQEALRSARSVLADASADQAAVDAAAAAVQAAMEALQAVQPEEADKTLLNQAIAYAESIENFEGVNELVLQEFQAALQQAKEVRDNPAATQDEVEEAWRRLSDVIHMLDFTSDKTALAALVQQARELNLDLYEEDEAKEEFRKALAYAEEVLDDPAAQTEQSIAAATARLQAAMEGLRLKETPETVDTSILELVISAALELNLDLFVPAGQSEFTDALHNAQAVLADPADQQQVDEAALQLNMAMLNLRLKADESLLAELQNFVDQISALSLENVPAVLMEQVHLQQAKVVQALADHANGVHVLSQDEASLLKKENDALLAQLQPSTEVLVQPSEKPEAPAATVQKPSAMTDSLQKPAVSPETESAAVPASPAASAKSVKTAAGGMHLWMSSAAAAGLGLLSLPRNRKTRR